MNKYEIYQVGDGYLIQIDTEFTDYSFYDIPKQIIDIIKQLEQENKQLKKQLELEIKVRDENHNYLHNKIDKAIELYKNCKAEDYCTLDLDMYNALIGGDIDEYK